MPLSRILRSSTSQGPGNDYGARPSLSIIPFDWINQGPGHLIVGGTLLKELKIPTRNWARQLQLAGRMTVVAKEAVDARTVRLGHEGACQSNDQHVIALAQISGARLLYTDDNDLTQDFKNKRLIDHPRGKVYPARGDGKLRDGSLQKVHQQLLQKKNLCRP